MEDQAVTLYTQLATTDLFDYLTGGDKDYFRKKLEFRFPNGYGASIVRGAMTYGGSAGLFELGVISARNGWGLDYGTPITNDVLGWLTGEDVIAALLQIKELA